MKSGLFISFEGGEGSGKTTQIRILADRMREKGFDVVTTREPGGTPEAEKIRNLLVDRNGGAWTPMAEVLLFFAARVMHVETLIRPAILAGKIVICDRFTDSTRAYQCYGHGLDMALVDTIEQASLGGFLPDLTFVLDVPVEAGLKRAGGRLKKDKSSEDKFERLDLSFHDRLRQGYLSIAKDDLHRCIVVDALKKIDDIAGVVERTTMEKINAI